MLEFIVFQRFHRVHGRNAASTPCGPKVDQHHFARITQFQVFNDIAMDFMGDAFLGVCQLLNQFVKIRQSDVGHRVMGKTSIQFYLPWIVSHNAYVMYEIAWFVTCDGIPEFGFFTHWTWEVCPQVGVVLQFPEVVDLGRAHFHDVDPSPIPSPKVNNGGGQCSNQNICR